MKFSTGLIGLALALNVHAAPKPSSSTAAKSTSTKPPATTSASPLVSSSTQQATTTTCRPPSVAQYSQCGGMGYTGSTTCTAGGTCVYVNEWYSQCMYCVSSTSTSTPRSTTPTSTPTSTPTTSSTTTAVSSTTTTCVPPSIMLWSQCGGQGYTGASTCPTGGKCVYVNEWYSQCMYCL